MTPMSLGLTDRLRVRLAYGFAMWILYSHSVGERAT
jgi:hypothetical protein